MMKRETLSQAVFALFLMILMPVSAWTTFRFLPEWNGFVASGAGTVLAIASYFAGRGRSIGYLLCTFFNTVGAGCAVGAFYHYQTPFPGVKELWLVMGVWTVFLLLYLLGMNLKAFPIADSHCSFPMAGRNGGFRRILVHGRRTMVELLFLYEPVCRVLERGCLCRHHGGR